MKKVIAILLAAAVTLAVSFTAAAVEMTTCTVMTEDAYGAPGKTVTVAVHIGDNPGYTNFAVSLKYDREYLTLKSIAAANADQFSANNATGYLVCANTDPVKENGELFTATFEIAEGFTGTLVIQPTVHYIRNNEAVFSIFENIHPTVTGGQIISVLPGDLTGDGIVEYDDVMTAYRAFVGEAELTAEQMAVVDSNANGQVDEAEFEAIYRIYIGG